MSKRAMIERVRGWEDLHWLRAGFTVRHGGVSTAYGGQDLNLGYTAQDDGGAVTRNRELLVEAVMPGAGLATLRQVHGTVVLRAEGGGAAGEADGMCTDTPEVLLGVQAADCVPILLVDTRQRAVAALHAGWRGTVAGMAAAGVAAMQQHFGSRVEDLRAVIGPSIGPCCFAVGQEVADRFPQIARRGRERFADLWETNRAQLARQGVEATVVGECTACTRIAGSRKYFSHRAEAGVTGRAMGVIGIAAV